MLSPHHLNKYPEKYVRVKFICGESIDTGIQSNYKTNMLNRICFLLPGNGPSRVFLASNSRLETVKKESNYLIKKQYFFFVLTECVQGVCVGQTPRCRDEIVDNTPHMLMVHHVQDCPLSCLNSEVLPLAGSDLSVFNGRGKQWGVFFSFFFLLVV